MGEIIEVWEDVEGLEDYYQISNLGRVRSKDRVVNCGSRKMLRKGRILKPIPNNKGYLRFNFKADGKSKLMFVHRIVAYAFCNKPSGCEVVNHINFDYTDNRACNLEWTTMKGNTHHSMKNGRMNRTESWRLNHRLSTLKTYKPVRGTNIKTGETVIFASMQDAGRNGFCAGSICNCCREKLKTHKGYTWETISLPYDEIIRINSMWKEDKK